MAQNKHTTLLRIACRTNGGGGGGGGLDRALPRPKRKAPTDCRNVVYIQVCSFQTTLGRWKAPQCDSSRTQHPTALRAVALSAFYGCRWVIVLRFDDGSTGRLGLRRTTWCAVTSSPCAAAAAAPPHPPAVPAAGPRPRWRRRCTGTRGSDSSTARCSGSIGRPSTASILFQSSFHPLSFQSQSKY